MSYKKTLNHRKASPKTREKFKNRLQLYKKSCRAIVSINESGLVYDMPRTHRTVAISIQLYLHSVGIERVAAKGAPHQNNVIIMDNAAFHKGRRNQEIIKDVLVILSNISHRS